MTVETISNRYRCLEKLHLSTQYSIGTCQHWNNVLKSSRDSQEEKDVVFELNCDQISLDRLVLAISSPVFEAMLHHQCLESLKGRINFNSTFSSIVHLHQFVGFLYGQAVELHSGNVDELLNVSVQYFVESLKKLCSQFLFNQLCPVNCISTWLTSSMYLLQDLSFVCKNLFWELLSFTGIQRDVITVLPEWFILEVLCVSSFIKFYPVLLPSIAVVWLLGDFSSRKQAVISMLFEMSVTESTMFEVFNCVRMSNREKLKVTNICSFFYKTKNFSLYLSDGLPKRGQYLSVMLVNELSNTAAFYCMEFKKWSLMRLPFYNGVTLGIILGNLLVRVVAKGSSAHLFNIWTRKSSHTPCVLNAAVDYQFTVMLLPTEDSYFILNGLLYVAIIAQRFLESKLTVFRYDNLSNKWLFLKQYPLPKNMQHLSLHTYSTEHNLVYFIINVRPRANNLFSTTAPHCEFSHVFLVDAMAFEVVGSTCGYFGSGILHNDCFILYNKIHFVTNRPSLLSSESSCARVLVVSPCDRKYVHILYPMRAPKLQRLPICRKGRKNQVRPKTYSALKESTLCLMHYMGPYISNMFIYDMVNSKWNQMPSPPPMFKYKPSKPTLIHTYLPVGGLAINPCHDVIPDDERFFKEWQLINMKV